MDIRRENRPDSADMNGFHQPPSDRQSGKVSKVSDRFEFSAQKRFKMFQPLPAADFTHLSLILSISPRQCPKLSDCGGDALLHMSRSFQITHD
jgi:hypothetical protein